MRSRHFYAMSLALIATGVACGKSGPLPPTAKDGDPTPVSYQGAYLQVDPKAPLADLFPGAEQISLGVLVLPDPLVPRYRRLYDLSIAAIELGMLHEGYVLDRYSLPWVKRGRQSKEPKEDGGQNPPAPSQADSLKGPEPFGLMVFRCDAWRDGHCGSTPDVQGSRLRALYVITDTATYGVSDHELNDAVTLIKQELTAGHARGRKLSIHLLGYPACAKWSTPASTLVVLGPNFSGAMDSLGERSASLLGSTITDVCLVSSSATNSTNTGLYRRYPHVHFVQLALDDSRKLDHLARLVEALRGRRSRTWYEPPPQTLLASGSPMTAPPQPQRQQEYEDFADVALLAESSTFGYGVCDQGRDAATQKVRDFCDSAQIVYFPSSIADIRYGLQQQQQEQQTAVHNPLKIAGVSDELPIQMGTENGSEYPESRQSGSTSVSKQRALEELLNELKDRDPPPRIIVVIATDVRDRLFLFDELRKRLPRAMLVDLDADNLLAHPDFLHASRGALALGSAALLVGKAPRLNQDGETESAPERELERFGCSSPQAEPLRTESAKNGSAPSAGGAHPASSSWSTDYQTILMDTVSRLSDSGASRNAPCFAVGMSRWAIPQVVTLEGFHQVALWPESAHFLSWVQSPLFIAGVSAPLFCLSAAWFWVTPWVRSRRGTAFVGLDWFAVVSSLVYSVVFLWVAGVVRWLDRDNTLPYWAIALVALGIWGLLRCRLLLQAVCCTEKPPLAQLGLPALLALGATVLAAMPLYWQHGGGPLSDGERGPLDESALLALALDPDQGLAFFLATAVGAAALLYASLALATAACVLSRNAFVLKGAKNAVQLPDAQRLVPLSPPNVLDCAIPGHCAAWSAAIVMGAIVLPDLWSGHVRLTVFGLFASRVALCALTATTLVAMVLLCAALRTHRRAKALSGYMRNAYLASRRSGKAPAQGEIPGVWPAGKFTPAQFPGTPAVARTRDAEIPVSALPMDAYLSKWSGLLHDWLHQGGNKSEHWASVFVLLASEISLHRWLIAGTVLCALASVGIVFLFPVESDTLLVLNLLILVAAGVLAGYTAVTYESDGVMSNVLCDRPKKVKLSMALFGFIVVPFVALAIAMGIANIPGVMDWSGGLITLMGSLGLHL